VGGGACHDDALVPSRGGPFRDGASPFRGGGCGERRLTPVSTAPPAAGSTHEGWLVAGPPQPVDLDEALEVAEGARYGVGIVGEVVELRRITPQVVELSPTRSRVEDELLAVLRDPGLHESRLRQDGTVELGVFAAQVGYEA